MRPDLEPHAVSNFGGNVAFRPSAAFAPHTEQELLEILRAHRGQQIRVVGRLHSWSDTVVCPEILIDLRHLNEVVVHVNSDDAWAEVGAGCQIKYLLDELRRQGNFTMPSLGLITEQTIAGAAATGTHGSGRHCVSHYVRAARLACYDPQTGEPIVRTIESGIELDAARCSLGCLGIITSVRLLVRRQYQVEEHFRRYDRLEEVLAAEAEFDLQQFYLVPWRWDFFAQRRREVDQPRSRLAPLYRLYWSVGMDVALHLVVLCLARWLPKFCTSVFFRWIMPALVPRRWKVVDRSDRQLTMEHELFRHIEIEVFVRREKLPDAIKYVTWLLRHCGGEATELEPSLRETLEVRGQWDDLHALRGEFVHHYPICVRKVLPDTTLISMASGDETVYALSFISYAHPTRRDGFMRFARALARTMAILFDARPHWGKVCPLDEIDVEQLYPRLGEFRRIVKAFDPDRKFSNDWTKRLVDPSSPSGS